MNITILMRNYPRMRVSGMCRFLPVPQRNVPRLALPVPVPMAVALLNDLCLCRIQSPIYLLPNPRPGHLHTLAPTDKLSGRVPPVPNGVRSRPAIPEFTPITT